MRLHNEIEKRCSFDGFFQDRFVFLDECADKCVAVRVRSAALQSQHSVTGFNSTSVDHCVFFCNSDAAGAEDVGARREYRRLFRGFASSEDGALRGTGFGNVFHELLDNVFFHLSADD